MRRDEDSYRKLVNHLPDGLARHEIVLDRDGKPVDYIFLDANPAFEALTGLKREQIRGRRATDAIPGIERTAFDWIGAYGRVALGGPSVSFEQFSELLGRWYEVTVFSDQPRFFTTVFRDITGRKQMEDDLRAAEERYRSLFDHSVDAIYLGRTDGTVIDVNQAWLDLFGCTRDELPAFNIADAYVDPADRRSFLRRVLESGSVNDEVQFRRKDGTVFDCARTATVRRDAAGNVTAFQGIMRDVTGRKQTERALREGEERLTQLARQSRTVAWEMDLDGLYTYVSPLVEDVLGFRPGEMVGKKRFYDLLPEQAREESGKLGLEAVRGGRSLSDVEIPVVSKDGRNLWFAVSGLPLRSDGEKLSGYRGWIVDITRRKQAELTLRASEERFRSLFENSVDAIYIGTPDGRIIDVNEAWLDLFGYVREDLSRIDAYSLYADPAERADFVRRMTTTGFVRDEVRYRRKDGSLFDCQRVQVVRRDERGNVVAYQGILRDVSQQKRDRADLERLARFDVLTGLLNRYSILEKLDEWLVHEKRYPSHLSVVMADIDHFKEVNDLHGHNTGDRVLAETAGLLQRGARETDFVGRYGGEEFLLILPRTDAAGAAALAERIRLAIQRTPMRDSSGGAFPVTVSFGVAEWREGDDEDSLVTRADAALYRAKADGRNRIEVAGPVESAG